MPSSKPKRRRPDNLKRHSIKYLEMQGYAAGDVERWLRIPGGRAVTKDFLGFGDVVAIGPMMVLIVQVTSRSNIAARVRKIRDVVAVSGLDEIFWGHPFVRIQVHGWSGTGKERSVKVVEVSDGGAEGFPAEAGGEAEQHSGDRGDCVPGADPLW